MCGIAGVVRLQGRIVEQDRAAVVRMLRAEAHRGPDGEGCFADDSVFLGHLRLAIIDLSDNGRQPMANETGDVWISVNGEIYNFRELRSELETCGHIFKSHTDTEVLLHGYEQWGLDPLLSRLSGMFAFALYDARRAGEAKLYLVRDRFGIKPLYYALRGERLLFASELTALVASGAVAPELDAHALTSFLEYGSIPGPKTALKDTKALPAGHYLEVIGGRFLLRRYWELGAPVGEGQGQGQGIGELLEESVKLHLVSDVPLGVFLSGGIDSATLVALASASTEAPLKTLSVVFDDAGLSEAHYARRVAERYHTDHLEISLDASEFLETLPDIFDAMDSPTVDGVNTYFVSRAAKRAGLTVVLTGLGGDEVFLGYPHYKALSRLDPFARLLSRLPRVARRGLAAAAKAIARRDKLDYLEMPTATNLYRMFRGLYSPRQIAKLVDGVDPELGRDEPLIHESGEALIETAVRLEFDHYLQHQLLRDTDAMSMAHSIEARVPFLDHRLVEAVYRLPHASKLARDVNKPLLVEALAEPLPREVWDRPKQGFTLPFRRFMLEYKGELRARARASELLRHEAVDEIWNDFESGRAHWSRPWALVAFTAWVDRLRSVAATARDEPVLETTIPR